MSQVNEGRLPVDQDARDRVSTVFDTSFAVEAGAGTGKTTVLVGRILSLVRSGTSLRNICAITFTDRAAAELRLRIRESIEAQLIAGTTPVDVWERALVDIESATISTIHAFAARLLRERPIEAGVSPSFGQHDAVQAQLFWQECWDRWLAPQLNREPYPSVLPRALRLGVRLEQLRELAAQLTRYRDVVGQAPAHQAPTINVEAFRGEFCTLVGRLGELAQERCVNRDADRGYQHISELVRQAAAIRELDHDDVVEFLNYQVAVRALGSQRNWQTKDDCKLQKDLCQELEERRREFLQNVKTTLVAELLAWLQGFLQYYTERKKLQGVLDFDDLLLLARDLLLRHPEVRRDFHAQYQYLLVDEFQDTDPLQAEIVFLLSDGRVDLEAWTQATPDEGRLFIVGDPKQSIYRFRRADIELYERARQQVLQAGESPRLVQNFRSVPALISWVNHVFGRLIQESPEAHYQPRYVPLSAFRNPVPGTGVTFLYPPAELDLAALPTREVRRWEAAYLACLIRDKVQGQGWLIVDRETGKQRSAGYGDIGILFPRITDREVYEEALARHGLPYRVEGGRQFFRTQEVQDLANTLRAVDHPHDEVAVVAALRSRLFGCTDEDLFRWVQAGGRFHLLQNNLPIPSAAPGAAMEASPEIAGSLALLRELHEQRSEVPPHRLLERLYAETRIIESTLLAPYGEQAAANLLKLLDRARSFYLDDGRTFGWFVRWLGEMRQEEIEEEESPIAESGEQVIQLLTVHKAKGLEFPVTILANLSAGRGAHGIPLIVDRQSGRYEVSIGTRDNGFETPGYEQALEREKQRLDAELRRLFYVAATRARDHLVVPFFYRVPRYMGPFQKQLAEAGIPATLEEYEHAATGDSLPPMHVVPVGGLNPIMDDPPAVRVSSAQLQAAVQSTSRSVDDRVQQHRHERQAWLSDRQSLLQRAGHGLDIVTPSSAVEWEEDPDQRVAGRDDDDAGGGAAFGSAFHALMERLSLPKAVHDRGAGREIAGLIELAEAAAQEFSTAEQARELARLCRQALELPVMVQWADRGPGGSWIRELPISIMLEHTLVEGKIDLLVRSGEHAVVVDYKTDRVFSAAELDARAEHYRPQAALYALMVTEALKQPVDEVVFAFVRARQERHFVVDEALLEEARQHLHRATDHDH